MKHELIVCIETSDPRSVFDHVADWSEFRGEGLPARASMGHKEVAPEKWRMIRDATNPTGGVAIWGPPWSSTGRAKQLSVEPQRGRVTLAIAESEQTVTVEVPSMVPLP